MSYLTVDEVRDYTGITSAQMDDDLIQEQIDSAEDWLHNYTGTIFASTEVTITLDGNDSNLIVPDYQPIISVSALYYSYDYGSTWTLIDSSKYKVKSWCIQLKPTSPVYDTPKQINAIKVVMNYGYSSLPAIVKRELLSVAGILSICYVYDKTITEGNLRLGDASIYTTNYVKKKSDILESAKESLLSYCQSEVMLSSW